MSANPHETRSSDDNPQDTSLQDTKGLEFKMFIFLTVFLAPILSVILVSGLGFAIWFSQILTGPPGTG